MTIQIALLRAINVGGRGKLAMADLRKAFVDLGYGEARTVLQTGNVVFSGKAGSAKHMEAEIEKALADCFDLKTDILIRSGKEWDAIIEANPFSEVAANDPSHLIVMPLKAKPAKGAIDDLNAVIKGREVVRAEGTQLYISYPDGIGRSKLTMALIERKIGTRGTGRNWNTVLKIAEVIRAG